MPLVGREVLPLRNHRWLHGRWYLAVKSDTYLGFLVPGMVITLVGALSSPAAMAACIRARNAPSMSKWVGFPLAMRSISVTRWNSSSLIWARLARLTCLFGFRDSYGLLDHLSSDSFDYGNDGLFDPPRSFLHWRAFGLGLGNRSLCSLDYLACLTAFSGVCSSQFGSALYFSLLGAPQHALMPDHQLIVGSYQQIAA